MPRYGSGVLPAGASPFGVLAVFGGDFAVLLAKRSLDEPQLHFLDHEYRLRPLDFLVKTPRRLSARRVQAGQAPTASPRRQTPTRAPTPAPSPAPATITPCPPRPNPSPTAPPTSRPPPAAEPAATPSATAHHATGGWDPTAGGNSAPGQGQCREGGTSSRTRCRGCRSPATSRRWRGDVVRGSGGRRQLCLAARLELLDPLPDLAVHLLQQRPVIL